MTPDAIAEIVQDVIMDGVGNHEWEIKPGAHLVDDLGFDELDRATVAIALERRLGIELSEEITDAWGTVGDIAASVQKAVHNRAPVP